MIDERILIGELERIIFEADIHKSYVQEVFNDMLEAVKKQPKATPIVRSVEEIADIMAHNMNCANCTILKQCDQKIRTCETKGRQACVDWLVGNNESEVDL